MDAKEMEDALKSDVCKESHRIPNNRNHTPSHDTHSRLLHFFSSCTTILAKLRPNTRR